MDYSISMHGNDDIVCLLIGSSFERSLWIIKLNIWNCRCDQSIAYCYFAKVLMLHLKRNSALELTTKWEQNNGHCNSNNCTHLFRTELLFVHCCISSEINYIIVTIQLYLVIIQCLNLHFNFNEIKWMYIYIL